MRQIMRVKPEGHTEFKIELLPAFKEILLLRFLIQSCGVKVFSLIVKMYFILFFYLKVVIVSHAAKTPFH